MNQNENIYLNSNKNINIAFNSNISSPQFCPTPQNVNFFQPQCITNRIYGSNIPDFSTAIQESNQFNFIPEKNKKEEDKKNLKGRSLIQEIIQDTEISMNQGGKDHEKNSNLYLCTNF